MIFYITHSPMSDPVGQAWYSAKLIDINEDNEYLLEDIEYCADNLSDYISDTYGYCHNGFKVKCC